MVGRPGKRGAGGRQTDNVKLSVGKQQRNITKGIKIALNQVQPRENKWLTNTAVVIGRDSTDEEEEQSGETGEEKVRDISDDEGARRVEN